jgi:hypothetical protein
MDLEILRKKLSSFKGEGGRVTRVSDDLLLEILTAWENWSGSAKEFYRGIGSNQKKMARMLGKAKQLKRDGHVMPFQELKFEGAESPTSSCNIEIHENNKVIKFAKVDLLIEYMKKVS